MYPGNAMKIAIAAMLLTVAVGYIDRTFLPFITHTPGIYLYIGGVGLACLIALFRNPVAYYCIGCEKKIDKQGRCACNPQGRPDWHS